MARGSLDIIKKNSKLESFLQRSLTAETFDRVRGYESCICVSEKENKAFKYVVLSDEWIYLTENPPKNIRGVVHLRDVVSVELTSGRPDVSARSPDQVNDYPEFLSGDEQKNTQHIAITHITNEPKRRRTLRRGRHSSPRGSVTDLQNGDRSSNSTPVGYASSLDGSEDVGYHTQSTTSLPRSRPTSRGSIGSQRDVRGAISKKKKKPLPTAAESWDHDSILRSLKEEIEEDMLEDIEEDQLSVTHNSTSRGSNLGGTLGASGDRRSLKDSQKSTASLLSASQTSVGRPLPPHPKTGAFETVATPPKVQSDKAGVVLSPVEVTQKSGCSCTPFFCRGNKSQVAPICRSDTQGDIEFSSKARLIGDPKNGIPTVAISTMSDDGRESRDGRDSHHSFGRPSSRTSSLMGGGGAGGPPSRSGTPSGLDVDRLYNLPPDLSGSVTGLHTLSVEGGQERQTVLHIYLLNSSSPMIMLIRGAWKNYLIRSTLALDPLLEPLQTNTALWGSKNQREKCEFLFNQLKQQLFDPSNSMEVFYQLFTDLKQATQQNFYLKKLFWRSGDIFALMVQQLQKYMPRTDANLHTEDGRAQRVDELDFVILIVTTLSLMFRESEILPSRVQALKTERGKYVIDLLMTLTSPPMAPEKQVLLMKHWSAPSKNKRFGGPSPRNIDQELHQLLSEYIRESITAVFELLLMAKQNQFDEPEGTHFTVSWMIKVMEETKNTEHFVERVMSQILEVINLARFGAVSSQQAVQLYQQFSLLLAILDHNSSILAFLRNHYHEEFKYFIQGPALARKLPTNFPITPSTIGVVSQVSSKVLGQSGARGSSPSQSPDGHGVRCRLARICISACQSVFMPVNVTGRRPVPASIRVHPKFSSVRRRSSQ
ncbi:hypothetical protein BaRGS_00018211 [Batillaria attramentaria]|uniref:Uncharacterized protein n=1 Tax=Batillaria attramentaria TaxID=370345 RepID=A0ABD0KUI9_9CAEN